MAYLDELLGNNERILIVERRHPLFLVGRMLPFLVLAVVLIVAGIWLRGVTTPIVGVIVALLALVPLALAVVRYLAWFQERYVVTNYRIVQLEGILNRRVLDSSLEKVNDIELTQSLFGRLFNFGTLEILTSSELGVNRLDALVEPFRFKRVVLDARTRLSEGEDGRYGHHDEALRLLAALNDLRDSGLISEAEYRDKRARLVGSEAVE